VSLALICGDASVWKPAQTTPLCAIATNKIIVRVLQENGYPGAISALICGGGEVGAALVDSSEVDLISFTGSEARGRLVSMEAAGKFKQSLLELGGNNVSTEPAHCVYKAKTQAAIVMPDANIKLALQSCTFAALGTAGQRCTTTRRLYLHSSIADDFLKGLVNAYKSCAQRIGRPEDSNTLIGPLHSPDSVDRYLKAVEKIKAQGGDILIGGEQYVHADSSLKGGNWVAPTIAFYRNLEGVSIIKEETFAPILHVATFETLDEAIALNNGVAQGLSSALFTQDMGNVFQWIGPEGSDCGSE